MLPPATGCEGREVGRWLVVALGHLELAAQRRSRSRRSCEAIVSGRNGTVTAQPARTTKSAAPAANFNVIQFADASGCKCSMSSPPLSDAFCPSVWLRWFNCGLSPKNRGGLTLMQAAQKTSKWEWLVKRPIAGPRTNVRCRPARSRLQCARPLGGRQKQNSATHSSGGLVAKEFPHISTGTFRKR